MKKIFYFIILFLCSTVMFAQNYYEVPYVGKKSKLTVLTKEEKDAFIKANKVKVIYNIPKNGSKTHSGFFSEEDDEDLYALDIYAKLMECYKEEVPNEKGEYVLTVYRLMYSFGESTNLNLDGKDNTERKCVGQIVFVPVDDQYEELCRFIYYGNERYKTHPSGFGVEANNVQFRICKGDVFIFNTELNFEAFYTGMGEEMTISYDKQSTTYIFKNNIYDGYVESDYPLIDKNNPFKYSIQNAFDGDPSTSYVEDSENDLFNLTVEFSQYSDVYEDVYTEIKFINGYSSTNDLYKQNNRIKDVQSDDAKKKKEVKFSSKDNTLTFQSMKCRNYPGFVVFNVESVYPGTDYSDTCLSEINFKGDKTGWYFKE